MKKRLYIFIAVMTAVALLASCSNGIEDPSSREVVISFNGTASSDRAITSSAPLFEKDSYYWTYTAEKVSNPELKIGEALTETPLEKGKAGLKSSVGPFSQGKWKFTLRAYKSFAADKYTGLVYEGENVVDLRADDNGHKVTVTVHPLQSALGKGHVVLPSELSIESLDSGGNKVMKKADMALYNLVFEYSKEIGTAATAVKPKIGTNCYELPSGGWFVTVSLVDKTDGTSEKAKSILFVQVYDNLETVLSGLLDEIV